MTNYRQTYCGQCGQANPKTNSFCISCGVKLEKAAFNEDRDLPSINYTSSQFPQQTALFKKHLDELIDQTGLLTISNGEHFIQYLREPGKSYTIFINLGDPSNFSEESQAILINKYKFQIIEGGLIKKEKIVYKNKLVSNLIEEALEIFNEIYKTTNLSNLDFELDSNKKKSNPSPLTPKRAVQPIDKRRSNNSFGGWIILTIVILALIGYCTSGDSTYESDIKNDHNPNPVSTGTNDQIIRTLEEQFRKDASVTTHIFKSFSNDREGRHIGEENQRYDVLTYHKFDFTKSVVTQYIVENGNYEKMEYPFNASDLDNDGMGYITIKVNSNGVKEIWFHEGGYNLGYDYSNGLRWAYYDLTAIK